MTCGDCGEPITDRHPNWPGVWTTLVDIGPQCDKRSRPYPEEDEDNACGFPHRPSNAVA
ncbi:hypothetical protein GCM10010319_24500 [Streptomyces blastmyceticus]|uniref:Uncharacterized protein n=1 Tax=Streptomyces blastmyceticus TaxID=68180 RepID=A0ABN0WUI0_9ACTN